MKLPSLSSSLSPQPSAFLFDLDGVFYNDTQPIPGGAEVIAQLRGRGVPFRFATNTTSKGRASLARKLQSYGVSAEPREIFCPAVAASQAARGTGVPAKTGSAMKRCNIVTGWLLALGLAAGGAFAQWPGAVGLGPYGGICPRY